MKKMTFLKFPVILVTIFVFLAFDAGVANATQYAILVGVSEYLEESTLPSAPRDAEALRDVLLAIGYKPENVICLTSGTTLQTSPIKNNIDRKIREVLTKAKSGDTVIIFMSGHGFDIKGLSQFMPADAVADDIMATTVSLDAILKAFQSCAATHKLMLVDACRAGDKLPAGALPMPPLVSPVPGVTFVQSCDKDQTSIESKLLKHGVFAYALLEGLCSDEARDKDGEVTLLGLVAHTIKKTKEIAADHNHVQTPTALLNISDDFVMVPKGANIPNVIDSTEYDKWKEEQAAIQAKIDEFLATYGEYGNDVKAVDEYGDTLLHKAVPSQRLVWMRDDYKENKEWDIAVINYLIVKGADVNAKDNYGETPLHNAIHIPEGIEIIKLLISQGANVNAKNNEGETPLLIAARGKKSDLVQFFISQGADVKAQDNKGRTLDFFTQFTSEEQREINEFIAKHGSDVKAVDEFGMTLLHKVITEYDSRSNYVDSIHICVVKFLVSRGADVNAKKVSAKNHPWRRSFKEGDTPLMCAVNVEDWEIAEYLISKGADVNVKNNYGETPLHRTYNIEFAKLLVSHGADVNVKNNYGWTPLHDAKTVEMAEFLVSKGANVNAKDNEGRTPLHMADGIETAKLLISQGANVNAKNNNGRTPLHYCHDVEVAKLLISKGVNVNAKDNNGCTPLHYCRDVEVAKLLISKGADVNAKNNDGWTPLHQAALTTFDSYRLTKCLISEGADMNAKTTNPSPYVPIGTTPLDIARLNNKEVAEYLESLGAKPGKE